VLNFTENGKSTENLNNIFDLGGAIVSEFKENG